MTKVDIDNIVAAKKWLSKPLMIHTADMVKSWFIKQGYKTIEQVAQEIDRWHKARNFSGIGYHFIVMGSEVLQTCRLDSDHGAHCKEGGMNYASIGVCIIGKGDIETPSKEELYSIKKIIEAYESPCILFHCDYSPPKTCPGVKVIDAVKSDVSLGSLVSRQNAKQ